jgi:hypothetical protein
MAANAGRGRAERAKVGVFIYLNYHCHAKKAIQFSLLFFMVV